MSRFTFAAAIVGAFAFAAPVDAATFLFVRHAESTTNAGTATTPEEIVDPPLTELGQQQALDLVDTLKDLDVTSIYVSSYQRTTLTIAPTADYLGLTPTVVPEISEWAFGTGELDYDAISAMFGAWLAGDTGASIEGVDDSESLDDLVARVVPGYWDIVTEHADEDGVILIVGHGGSIGWTMPYFAENVSLPFALSNGQHNTGIVEVELVDGVPYVTNWEGTALDWPGAAVPLPASALLLLGALGGFTVLRRRA